MEVLERAFGTFGYTKVHSKEKEVTKRKEPFDTFL
jgi:hypothetical protein